MLSSVDPSVTEHIKRSEFLMAVARAIEFEGLPAPATIGFEGDTARLVMATNAAADVDDWAAHLKVQATNGPLLGAANGIRTTGDTQPVWHGYKLTVWCVTGSLAATR